MFRSLIENLILYGDCVKSLVISYLPNLFTYSSVSCWNSLLFM